MIAASVYATRTDDRRLPWTCSTSSSQNKRKLRTCGGRTRPRANQDRDDASATNSLPTSVSGATRLLLTIQVLTERTIRLLGPCSKIVTLPGPLGSAFEVGRDKRHVVR